MSAATEIATLPRRGTAFPGLASLVTLARRRFQLTVRTPRELVVPLVTPILFALVIAPALRDALHTSAGYESLVAVGTVGLLIPLNTMFSGLSVIGDREQGDAEPARGRRLRGAHGQHRNPDLYQGRLAVIEAD